MTKDKNNNSANAKTNKQTGRKRGRAPSELPPPKRVKYVNPVARTRGAKFANNPVQTIPDVSMAEMRRWVENHYSLKECFLIPREQRTYVQPHKWDFSSEIINEVSDPDTTRLAIKLRPSVNNFLSIGKAASESQTKTWDENQEDESEYPVFQSNAMGSGISFDENIRLVSGEKLKAGLVDRNVAFRYLDGGDVKLGLKMYPGSLPDWDGKVQMRFYNPDNAGAGMELTVKMLREDFDGNITVDDMNVFTVPANGIADVTSGPANPAAYADIKAFGFAFLINNQDVIGRVPSGMVARFGFPGNVTIVNPFVWRDFDVWSLINDKTGALRQQYESSNFHCFTALHATLTNTQAEIYKGGTIQAAQLSGLSDDKLPHTFVGLDTWIGNRTYDTNKEKSLAKGLHWNYRWEKVQDTFFITRDAEAHEGQTRPSMVATLVAPPINDSQSTRKFNIRLHGALMIEYITEVRDAPVFLAPADTVNLLARYCAIRAELPCLMENPSHWKTIKENVTKIMNHPVTKTIAKEAAMAGLKLLLV